MDPGSRAPAGPRPAIRPWLLAAAVLVAVAARYLSRDFLTGDVELWVVPWYDFLREHGIAAIGRPFPGADGPRGTWGTYPPPYYYLLYVATLFDGVAPKLYLIKAVSIAFDLVAAAFVFGIVRQVSGSTGRAWAAACAILLAPTLIANGALWGQCDSIHTSLVLGAIYFGLAGRPAWAAVAVGVALSVKAQAVFLLPWLLLLALGGRLPWGRLALVPGAWAVMMVPAWLAGRPLVDLLAVYARQGLFFDRLSMNAANLYYFAPASWYGTGVATGITLTIAAALVYAVLPSWRRVPLTPQFLLLSATVSVALAPFLLPKMHDRYFLAADLASIALALAVPRFWSIAVGFQFASLLAYVPIITDALAGYQGEYLALMPVAVALNTVLVTYLGAEYWRAVRGSPPAGGGDSA